MTMFRGLAGVSSFHGQKVAANPSIERTAQSLLRSLWPAAHVELQGLPRFVKYKGFPVLSSGTELG
jgi:hypothetical protein